MPPYLTGVTVEQRGHSLACRYAGKLLAELGAGVFVPNGESASDPFDRWLAEGTAHGEAADADVVLTESPDERGGRVTVFVEPFGEGPYAGYAYSDLVAYALTGWCSVTGLRDRYPLAPALPLPMLAAGAGATCAALLALAGVRSGRGGGHARVSVLDTLHRMFGPWTLYYPLLGNMPTRSPFNGYRWSLVAPCLDGYVVTPMTRPDWDLVGTLLGEPRLQESRWRDPTYTLDHRDEVLGLERARLGERTRAEIVEVASALGLPWSAVQTANETLSCPQLAARGFWRPPAPGTDVPNPRVPFVEMAHIPGEPVAAPDTIPAHPAGPLSGVVVLELTVAWAGPFAGRILADAGATVIKVESGRRPDTSRSIPVVDNDLGTRWWDRSLSYSVANGGKYHIGLEIDTRDGRELLLRLIRDADVVINNHAPRVLQNLGLTFEEIARLNPNVVYVTSTGFGSDGPYRDRNSLGWTIEAMCGITANTGYPDGEPIWSRMPFPDVFSAMWGAIAVGAGLAARHHAPGARWLDVSQYECGVHGALPALLEAAATGRERPLMGNRYPRYAPQGIYACAGDDAWLAISVVDDGHWGALCDVIGRPDLAEQFPDAAARREAHDLLDGAIAAWCAAHAKEEARALLQDRGVASAAVHDSREVFFDQHHRRHNFVCAANEEAGTRPWPGPWQQYDGAEPRLRWATPRFGQHNDLVLGEWLGLPEGESARLREERVLKDLPEYAVHPASGGLPPERMVAMGEIKAHDPTYREAAREFCGCDETQTAGK